MSRPALRPADRVTEAVEVLAETRDRLRLRVATPAALRAVQAVVQTLPGVRALRAAPSARSLVIHHDGRRGTRDAVLAAAAGARPVADSPLPRKLQPALPIEWPLLAGALAPLLPPPARAAAAVALVAGKSLRAWRRGDDLAANTLDAIALASTALTGHALTATTALLLGSVAERRRDRLLLRFDALLDALVPPAPARVRAERGGRARTLPPQQLHPGDLLDLDAGDLLAADALVVDGQARVLGGESTEAAFGTRLPAGARVLAGRLRLRVERPAAESRSARLRSHVRHLLNTRDAPGALTPDLERLVALPMTAAGLVLALTGDAERTASMLQADPQLGVAMAQPVAREAAVYAAATSGALLMGMAQIDRLARTTAIAFEDVGVLAAPLWQLDRLDTHDRGVSEAALRDWLAGLAGHGDARLLAAGLPDAQVAHWREHGCLLRLDGRLLHVAGAALIERTWGLAMAEPDRRSLVRRLGVVEDGRLIATVHLRCALDVEGVRARFAALRVQGVERIAVFTEDAAAEPAAALLALGADEVISSGRAAQAQWLAQAAERGAQVALVHTGLRELLPPGGLSLCPVDAEAGAHGVLLAEPLTALVNARATAQRLRGRLRRDMGVAVSANALLMIAAAMRWLPPIGTTLVKHGIGLALLERSARLAHVRGEPAAVDARAAAAARSDQFLQGATR